MKTLKNNRNKRPPGKKQPVRNKLFPIVAVGASAGGLEAYTSFLNNLPDNTGMSFVMVMHLDRKHKSKLKDILTRETSMEVVTLRNNMEPKPNVVYVMPQNIVVEFQKGIFKTYPRPHNQKNMPIDIFMISLAEDETHYSIGVELSGTDSDGVLGLEAIKAHGGITFAQDSKSARFPDMPENAVKWQAVDYVLTPQAIAREIGKISRNRYLQAATPNSPDIIIPEAEAELSRIFTMLYNHNGIDFKDYKPTTVKRRLLRRMVMHKITSLEGYAAYLRKYPREMDALCDDILINVTSFFRDPKMFESLKANVFPALFEGRDAVSPVRLWICGCSTGEEGYSMAIALAEYMEENHLAVPVNVFATDLSEPGIAKARAGRYPLDIKNDVSSERLRKYFTKIEGMYRVNKDIREMCIFAKQNLIQDPPFSKIDLVSCRNVMIYFSKELQNKVIPIFHYATNENGFLVLGTSDSITSFPDMYDVIDKRYKIYKKRPLPQKINRVFAPVKFLNPSAKYARLRQGTVPGKGAKVHKVEIDEIYSTDDYKKRADTILLNTFAPASVVINKELKIIQFRGKNDKYFDFPQGEPTFNLLKIAKAGLAYEIRNLIESADKNDSPVRKDHVEILHEGSFREVNLIVNPIYSKGKRGERLFLIVFEEPLPVQGNGGAADAETKTQESVNQKLTTLKNELAFSKDSHQATIEQLESANIELLSANQEVLSGNEELQSANEELETAMEELQSTNEELITVNEELQKRNAEISIINKDLGNFLKSVNIPIIMVDSKMKIRRYTSATEKLLNISQEDIGGRITSVMRNITVPDIEKLINEVIEIPEVKELEVRDNKNCWYSMRLRPYMTQYNKIDGVIIAFIDITHLHESLKEIEQKKCEIEGLNSSLEQKVTERTSALNRTNDILNIEIAERRAAEDSLRLLSKHLVNAQETERLRLSRELHDGVNQLLAIVKRKVMVVSGNIKKHCPPPVTKDLNEAEKLLNDAIEEVKKVSRNLRPAAIDDLGLASAVKIMIEEFRDRTGIKTRLDSKGGGKRMLPEAELHTYRIIQEALHNIEKHSQAKTVTVKIFQKGPNLNISVKDDGKGFKLKKYRDTRQKNQFGLVGMKERAESLGGTLYVLSVVGKGTEIKVVLPLI